MAAILSRSKFVKKTYHLDLDVILNHVIKCLPQLYHIWENASPLLDLNPSFIWEWPYAINVSLIHTRYQFSDCPDQS